MKAADPGRFRGVGDSIMEALKHFYSDGNVPRLESLSTDDRVRTRQCSISASISVSMIISKVRRKCSRGAAGVSVQQSRALQHLQACVRQEKSKRRC